MIAPKNFILKLRCKSMYALASVERASDREQRVALLSLPRRRPIQINGPTTKQTSKERAPSPTHPCHLRATHQEYIVPPTLALDSIQAEENSETSVLLAFFSSRLCPLDDIRTG